MIIDIHSKADYPASALSNFTNHSFVFNAVACRSMEGLLQSLKFQDIATQNAVCQMDGPAAKEKGMTVDWRPFQTLWWQGQPMSRQGDDYQQFLTSVFMALYTQNEDARMALLSTGDAELIHSIGVQDACETVLTEREFCSRLMNVRNLLKNPN